jgi:hypothetical protein
MSMNGKYERVIGSRAQVMHGTAHHTSGGLTKSALKYNSDGRIVSVAKSMRAKKERRLEKAGYFTEKGKFGFVRRSPSTRARRSRGRKSPKQ